LSILSKSKPKMKLKTKLLLILLFVFETTIFAQSHQIIAGQKTNVRYSDLIPNLSFECYPGAGSETCGPMYYDLDINGDMINDYRLEVYHSGLNGASFGIHNIYPYGHNMVMADTFNYFTFGTNTIFARALPIDSGLVISDAGIVIPDSVWVSYTDQWGFPNDSIAHFQRHFVFTDTVGKSFHSFFMNIPTVGMNNTMWVGATSKVYVGLKFFTTTDTIYGWLNASNYSPSIYDDYACTGDTASYMITEVWQPIEAQTILKVFPNPADDKINVYYNNNSMQEINYKLFDNIGRILKSIVSKQAEETIDLKALAEGIYFLQIQNNYAIVSKKIMICR